MKKLWILGAVLLVAIFGGRAWYLNQNKTDDTAVKIGVLLPLSGDASRDGQEALLAAKMAQEDANLNNNIKIKIIPEDSKYSSKDSINAFNKLSMQGISAISVFGDVPSLAVIPLLKENPMAVLTMAGDASIPPTSPWTFQSLIPIKQIADTTADYMIKDLKLNKVALLYIKCQGGDEFLQDFTNRLKQNGTDLLISESFKMGDMDTKAQISKILSTQPDGVFVYGWGPGYVSALNYLKNMRFNGAILTDFNIIPNTGILVEKGKDIMFLDLKVVDNTFEQNFYQKHQVKPNIFTTFTYESVKILANVIQSAKDNKEMIKEQLSNLKDYPTSIGNISFGKDGEIIGIQTTIKQLQSDGTEKIVKE